MTTRYALPFSMMIGTGSQSLVQLVVNAVRDYLKKLARDSQPSLPPSMPIPQTIPRTTSPERESAVRSPGDYPSPILL